MYSYYSCSWIHRISWNDQELEFKQLKKEEYLKYLKQLICICLLQFIY